MLKSSRGFTLIELMVGLTILAFLLMSSVSSMSDWIRNSQIRSAAESIITGLNTARAEAVKRNTTVRFQLTSTLGNDCTLDPAGKNWVINLSGGNPAGQCGKDLSDAADPYLLQKTVATDVNNPILINASQAALAFTGLGRQGRIDPAQQVTAVTIDVSPATSGTCRKDGGKLRCLRIVVSPAGQARMCDPSLSNSSNDQPMACPT
ncbi:MAG: GspH/FimT family pseudopilin [Aquabacterium sp.]|nr:GspH/FimT family pseudopilin [Aquabacterium sp.]